MSDLIKRLRRYVELANIEGSLKPMGTCRLITEAADVLERMQWSPDMEAAPYEKNVLTLWEGSAKKKPVMLINIKCDGHSLGSRDSWWKSRKDQWPTKWMHLPPE